MYGRSAHIYGLQSRRDEKNAMVGDKRKDYDAGGRNNQDNHNKSRAERVYHCKKCNNNHPGRGCKGQQVTCNYCLKKGHREYECFTKQKKEQNGNGSGNQVRSGFN